MPNDMSCWTIVEHIYGIFTVIIISSFQKLFNCTTFHPSQALSGTTIDVFKNSPTTHIINNYMSNNFHVFLPVLVVVSWLQ